MQQLLGIDANASKASNRGGWLTVALFVLQLQPEVVVALILIAQLCEVG
jgi:hypothetical protein